MSWCTSTLNTPFYLLIRIHWSDRGGKEGCHQSWRMSIDSQNTSILLQAVPPSQPHWFHSTSLHWTGLHIPPSSTTPPNSAPWTIILLYFIPQWLNRTIPHILDNVQGRADLTKTIRLNWQPKRTRIPYQGRTSNFHYGRRINWKVFRLILNWVHASHMGTINLK